MSEFSELMEKNENRIPLETLMIGALASSAAKIFANASSKKEARKLIRIGIYYAEFGIDKALKKIKEKKI
jgi:hypothetical protein